MRAALENRYTAVKRQKKTGILSQEERLHGSTATEIGAEIALRAAKIVLALAALYPLSYFIVFYNNFPYTDPVAVNSRGEFVGPTPNPLLSNGYIPPYSTSHEEIVYFTGEEWPFKMYRPFVNLYIQRENRYLHSLDKKFEQTEKSYWEVNERLRKAKEKYERAHPRDGH